MSDLVYLGDAHLERDDPHLEPFLAFLDRLAASAGRIVFMGDLFNLWIGRREVEQPHHRAVLAKLAEIRRRGVVVRYLEGNRDYRIGPCYVGEALDDAASDGLAESFGGRRLWAVHGDMANAADRRYRAWRRISRSALVWKLFNLVPQSRRLSLADSLEARLRRTNLEFKQEFPEAVVRSYGATFFEAGYDIVVLGHFHVEKDLRVEPPGPSGRILVLPAWKESHRHLRVGPDGDAAFVDSV